MARVDGAWNCVARTPMGAQEFMLVVKSDGDSFSGEVSGALGSMDIENGVVDGDTLTWSMEITSPFPMKLSVRATVDEDELQGIVDAGIMGAMPLSGARND
jgi:hypothetical protein